MKTNFAKLFETEYGQLLVTIEDAYADSDNVVLSPLAIRGEEYRGLNACIKPGYDTPEEARLVFDAFDELKAIEAVKEIRSLIDTLMAGPPSTKGDN